MRTQSYKSMLTMLRACVFNYSTSLYLSEVVTLENYIVFLYL